MRYGAVYWRGWVYDLFLWVVYRARPMARFRAVAEEIPDGASVLDLCAGTGMFARALAGRGIQYTAIDINPRFVSELARTGLNVRCGDVTREPFGTHDVVTMNSSLYHFGPTPDALVRKMVDASRHKAVILEPVHNLADARLPLLARVARASATVDGVSPEFHFTRDTFVDAMRRIDPRVSVQPEGGGRDMLAVFRRGPQSPR